LNPVVRIGRQVTESLKFHRNMGTRAATERAVELLSHVGIPSPERRLRAYPHELSGGMRQRVCIAMALACEPKVLVADEPTTALDVTIQRQILDLLQRLQRELGMAMILVTHNLGIAAGRTDDIAVMYAGRIVEKGPTRELFARMRHPYTAALLSSIPRIEHPSQTRLNAIPGRPSNVIDPTPGCRFANRCRHAQPDCLTADPPLVPAEHPSHAFACFYPTGTPDGDEALARNLNDGRTAAGLDLRKPDIEAA
jgi:peptide/nickel transport system ATP-binding protein